MVRACVLFAAGTNCDRETVTALTLAGAEADTVHINRLKATPALLRRYQLLVLPGGFSYGDYIASGRILATEIGRHLADEIRLFHRAGKPVLGICNGFQVLVKAGLLPACEGLFERQTVTLDANDSGRFEDRWVHLLAASSPCIFTRGIEGIGRLPVAHAEGRFTVLGQDTLDRLAGGHQVVFRYVTADGGPARYPENPNGSVDGIAGICDPSGLILGMMPHPERYVRPEHNPRWHREGLAEPFGIAIFRNAVRHVETHA